MIQRIPLSAVVKLHYVVPVIARRTYGFVYCVEMLDVDDIKEDTKKTIGRKQRIILRWRLRLNIFGTMP